MSEPNCPYCEAEVDTTDFFEFDDNTETEAKDHTDHNTRMKEMSSKINTDKITELAREHNIGRMGIEPEKWGAFCHELVMLINYELNEEVGRVVDDKACSEPWICLQVKGQQVIVLGSWTAKPDLVALSNVHKLETILSIAQVKTLISELEVKLDNFSSFRLMRVEAHQS